MTTVRIGRLSALLLVVAVAGAANAQNVRFRGSDGWGAGTRYEQAFDNFNLRTVVATVLRVDTASPARDMGVGVRLIVSIDASKEEIPVHLGPMWFALNQDVNFPRNEKVEVRGFRAAFEGATFIMPVEIRSRNRIFRFRDDDGNPFWSIHRPR
ncbi:MAG: hypothetical protein FWC23_09835 [Chitinispirillia bacterium]|nr:hypothetical protein [Chitinispirillia bacterium]MCL2269469.1 hypothetical protein [Chitinispirillia bacterium]